MRDVRIRAAAGCIESACEDRLRNKNDTREIRDLLRGLAEHAKEIIRVDALIEEAAPADAEIPRFEIKRGEK